VVVSLYRQSMVRHDADIAYRSSGVVRAMNHTPAAQRAALISLTVAIVPAGGTPPATQR